MIRKIRTRIRLAAKLLWSGTAVITALAAQGAPNPPVTNNGVVIFQGNQSQGITNGVTALTPATMLVTNLTSDITPATGTPGIQMSGAETSRNLLMTVDSNVVVNTFGDGAYGIHMVNAGISAGTYAQVTNSYTITTNVVNGTNVVTVVTNFESGSSNTYVASVPVGGVVLNNQGKITTHGDGAHGIFAESQPGSITFTLTNTIQFSQSYGNAGPVSVANSGDITTGGAGAHGIFAQSIGGFGPENSPTSGYGGDVQVSAISGTILTTGTNANGIFAQSRGGDNQGGESGGLVHDGTHGGDGGNSGSVGVSGGGTIVTRGDNSAGIFALSQAGNGGPGGNGGSIGGAGANGGIGGAGSNVTVSGNWKITTQGSNATGIMAQSLGGRGGDGGNGSPFISTGTGSGGGTGNGGAVSVTSLGDITTQGSNSLGILARSVGGFAGNGGNSYNPFYGNAGDGNSAGAGGNVGVVNGGAITTQGADAQAIYAISVGGGGGAGGVGKALVSLGASGGAGGNAGTVTVSNLATLTTFGNGSHGIEAQSLGGGGGDGGNAGGLVALGGTGSTGSTSSVVMIYNIGGITTHGGNANAILAQSIGGGGGNAGDSAGVTALGGQGNGGGDGAAVRVFNAGTLTATGSNSYGIFAQSIGGGGGSGGGGTGLAAIGGSGGSASKGDVVNVLNTGNIFSSASAIFAQSIGGGGGNGGNSGGWFSVGGSGNGGGDGAAVNVTNTGRLETTETNASALTAQSVGGGGGNGGNSVAVGAFVSMAIGGSAGLGGNGDTVKVVSGTNTITTHGDNSYGIDAESVGGGGGQGGYAVAVSAGNSGSASISIGGQGGGGGNASNVTVNSQSDITTYGTNSHGIFAQSIGGGGGSGGFAVSIAGSGQGPSLSLAMGGKGGTGGSAGTVTVDNSGNILTFSDHSYGILAQSVGGGGGDGGFAISGAFSTQNGSIPLAFGGSGNTGGSSSNVMVLNSGNITTGGNDAHAIEVQSVGGGGGSGGFSVAGGVSAGGSLAASFGGSGAGGGSGAAVGLTNSGNLLTTGDRSDGILAQSLGGGGGNGGFSVAGAISKSPALSLSLGGSAGGGDDAGSVTVLNHGNINTSGEDSHGIFAQSLGGGGGQGGFSVAGSISQGASASLSIGGTGGSGGTADFVSVNNTGNITTDGMHSYGILAQSVGGGGGDGGFSVAGDIGKGPATAFSMGGAGGSGSYGGAVTVNNSGNITTYGALSYGIFAQSLGGGGGAGGFSVSGELVQDSSGASFTIGGQGGPGVDGSTVTLANSGNITTTNSGSHAIFAESVGGGGGAGGFAGSLSGSFGDGASLAVAIGGTGGSGGSSGNVSVTNSGILMTKAAGSTGIYAQSVGGGGGDGGFGLAAAIGTSQKAKNASVAIGGNGGSGGFASDVTVNNTGAIMTLGSNSAAIFAESLGGGGGSGGFAASGSFATGTNAQQVSVSIGGAGSNGNYAGSVFVTNTALLVTSNYSSVGIFAQSIGGSGGNGGMSFTGTISRGASKNVSLAVGGTGGTGGDADVVRVVDSGAIMTSGALSHGIFAQSVGGGGGYGGLAAAVDLATGNTGTNLQFAVSIGGSGGAGGRGSNVFVGGTNTIITTGNDSYGVFAQSVGGGGGAGGMSVAATGVLGAQQGTNRALAFTIGGGGGSGNIGGDVTVDRSGDIGTTGDGSYGIMAQSIGGGGGDGGAARSFSLFTKGGGAEDTNTSSKSIDISIGGNGAGASKGGTVMVTNVGNIITQGADAYGIFAQSVGGGGGSGGAAHSSTDELIPIPIPGLADKIEKTLSTESSQYQVVVGGKAGSGGDGDHVMVNQTGNIKTMDDGSYGIFAQSVGAGGGVGGNGGLGQDGKIGIGGSGGAAGNGGAVDVLMNGNIFTGGAGSAGIMAQSVGGGGGIAGNVDRGQDLAGLELSKGLAFGQDGGSAGDGGAVTVTSIGNITTAGNGAYGIFAQSVGGGGGLLGDLGNDIPGLSSLTDFAGSVGGDGNGGNVTINHTGIIKTYGTNSPGIFAQSAGGSNNLGGNINITLNGAIYANGVNSDGIYAQSGGGATVVQAPIPTTPPTPIISFPSGTGLFAQSVGGGGGASGLGGFLLSLNGNVYVMISSNSVVQGGSGNSAGVRFVDGANNTLINLGLVTTLGGVNGLAVSGTNGVNNIDNFGTIVGSIDLGTNLNTFFNGTNGALLAGNRIALGANNILLNTGIVALGDSNSIMRTSMSGNFQQEGTGSLQIKLASPMNYDSLNVTNGWAALSGNLAVFRYTNYLPVRGVEFNILTATNVSGQFASLSDPYLGNYAIRLNTIYSPTNVLLQVVQDSFLKFAFTGNQRSLSQNLNSFAGVGMTNGDPRGKALIDFLDTEPAAQLPIDMDLLSPDEFGSLFDLNFASVNMANGNLQQRMRQIRNGNHETGGSISSFNPRGQTIQIASADRGLPPMSVQNKDDDWAAFVSGNGQYVDVTGTQDAAGYHFHNSGVTLGLDKMFRTNFAFGVTLDYSGTLATLVNDGQVKVDGGRGGFYGTWFDGNNYIEASAGGGYNHYTTSRIGLGGTAYGDTDGYEFDGMIGGGHDYKRGNLYFGPTGNARYTYVRVNGFTETGSLAPLQLQDNTSQSFLTQFGAHVGYNWELPQVTLRPDLGLAWQHEYLDQNRTINSRFASGAGSIFQVNSPNVGRDSVTVDAGVSMLWTKEFSTFIAYHGDLARQNYVEHSISGGASVKF